MNIKLRQFFKLLVMVFIPLMHLHAFADEKIDNEKKNTKRISKKLDSKKDGTKAPESKEPEDKKSNKPVSEPDPKVSENKKKSKALKSSSEEEEEEEEITKRKKKLQIAIATQMTLGTLVSEGLYKNDLLSGNIASLGGTFYSSWTSGRSKSTSFLTNYSLTAGVSYQKSSPNLELTREGVLDGKEEIVTQEFFSNIDLEFILFSAKYPTGFFIMPYSSYVLKTKVVAVADGLALEPSVRTLSTRYTSFGLWQAFRAIKPVFFKVGGGIQFYHASKTGLVQDGEFSNVDEKVTTDPGYLFFLSTNFAIKNQIHFCLDFKQFWYTGLLDLSNSRKVKLLLSQRNIGLGLSVNF